MTIYKILTLHKPILEVLSTAGINRIDKLYYINIYQEYKERADKGEKVSFIVLKLAEKYNLSERTIYKIIRLLSHKV